MRDTASVQALRSEFFLLVAVIIWAANYAVTKYGITGLDEFVFNGIRYVIAAFVLLGTFRLRAQWTPVVRGDWPHLLRAGLVANILYQVAFIVGLSLTTAGNSAVLLATSPLWTIIINARLHGERIRRNVWAGMAISLAGVVMIILGSGARLEIGGGAMVGDVITLGAAMLWAFSTNLQKPLVGRYPPMQVTLVMVSVGAIGLSILAVPGSVGLSWQSVHWTYYLAAAGSGLLSIAAGNVFWSSGVKHLGPGRTANFSNLTPVLALFFSFVVLGEELLPVQIAGAGVTIAGVWYARR
jgi:drug/metabolite transporter (DMT)-like permease